MKNNEKKQLRLIIEQLNKHKDLIEQMSEEVTNRCDDERERNENSVKIDKFEEEETSLNNLVSDIEDLQENLNYIIDGCGY